MSKKLAKIMSAVTILGGAAIVAHKVLRNVSDSCIMKDYMVDGETDDILDEIAADRTIVGKTMCFACKDKHCCPWATSKVVDEAIDKVKDKANHIINDEFDTSDKFEDDSERDSIIDEIVDEFWNGYEEEYECDDSFEEFDTDLGDDNIEYENESEEDFKSSIPEQVKEAEETEEIEEIEEIGEATADLTDGKEENTLKESLDM